MKIQDCSPTFHPIARSLCLTAAWVIAAAAGTMTLAQPELVDMSTVKVSAFKTEHGASISKDELDGESALKVEVPQSDSYPGVDLPKPAKGVWDLSGYTGLEVEIANQGPARLNFNVRVDNPGDWRQSPWNTGNLWLGAGKSGTVRVTFGSGYKLDPSMVNTIKIMTDKPSQASVFFIKSIRAAGSGNASGASAAATVDEGVDATFSPSIGGGLMDLSDSDTVNKLKYNDARGTVMGEKLHVTYQSGAQYPNVQFPIPDGGWDLSAFGGIELTITNPGDRAVTAHMRVDNPGNWKTEPWNTHHTRIGPGETETLQMIFGQNNDAPGFPLNSARVSAIQLFTIR
ncbi:MAG: hypothetical protein PF795_06825, partial [Kiritimatiellae bacterium]|nr:hypothetical protein [Kiritimatiellia bacterium]